MFLTKRVELHKKFQTYIVAAGLLKRAENSKTVILFSKRVPPLHQLIKA